MLDLLVNSEVVFEKEWTDYRLFALRAHGDQKYGSYPYAYHLAMVENTLDENGFRENSYRAAAWLHDCLEDTKTHVADISHFYGVMVAGLVWACTGVGATRATRNEEIFKRLAIFPEAVPVKVADRISNLTFATSDKVGELNQAKIKMYLAEWPLFNERVRPLVGDSRRDLLLWNYLCDVVDKAELMIKS